MKHETFEMDSVSSAALRSSMNATFQRNALLAAAGGIATAIVSATVLIMFVVAPSPAQLFAILAGLMVFGGGASLLCAALCARWAARIATDPLELVIGHLTMMGEIPPTRPNWRSARALTAAEIREDVTALDRLFRSAQRRARANMNELNKARELATAQNEAKSQFLATMSHELRTPLNAILGYAMLLQEDAEDSGNKSAIADLERIQQAGRNLLALINDILDLSRIETGKAVVQRTIIDVHDLVGQVVRNHSGDEKDNGNKFSIHIDEELGVIFGDGPKLRQCLENLMSNAFKFTHGGTITLSVKDAKTEAFPAIIFSISDTGIGIGEQDLTALFEAFEQGENHQTRRFGGAGIGLAITRRLARLMGGDCWAESIVGQGSTFYLLIPNDHRKDAAEEQQLLVDHNGDGREGGGKTVLVIEDDDDSLQLMRRWLGQMGFNVLAANDSRIGLESATTDHPDLVLVDALMPGISGYELLRQLRANSHTASIPVVVITVDDDPTRGLAAGASDYLRKPIMKSELRALVELYCGKVSGEVLIIDDDDAAADLIGRSVREIGFASRHATNGLEGLAMARESRPKAIVLDLTMPELDGFGVLDRLHADSGLREVPLIVLSGRRISVEEHRHLVASGHRYFVKGASTPRQIAQSLKELVA